MLTFYVANAFITNHPFSGNPAAVCVLEKAMSETQMQRIAAQHNLSETAFLVSKNSNHYGIRWFTPSCEVELCGHATLAAAHVLREFFNIEGVIRFDSASGELTVEQTGAGLTLNFPTRAMSPIEDLTLANHYRRVFQAPDAEVLYFDNKAMVIVDDALQVTEFSPDFSAISQLPAIIVYFSAPAQNVDFICRVFAPKAGIPEDPVTGSAYTSLTPYWAKHYGKNHLTAEQRSARGGAITLQLADERVHISGSACTVIKGEWLIEV